MPPAHGQNLYNSRAIVVYLRLLQKSYPEIGIPTLLESSGIKSYQIADPGHWFTQEEVDLFYEKLLACCKNPEIAREAGRYAASVESLGPFGQYLLGMLGPSKAFALISKIAPRLTRSSLYTSRRIGPRTVEVTVKPHVGVEEKPYQCKNRLGWFEAVVHMFNLETETLEHPRCLFRGDDACQYIISWTRQRAGFYKKLRNYGLLASPFLLPLAIYISTVPPISLLLGGGLVISTLMLLAEIEDKSRLKHNVERIRSDTEKALNNISTQHDNALLSDEIARAIGQETKAETILERVVELVSQRMGFDRVMVFLPNRERRRLELRTKYGFSEEEMPQGFTIPLDPSHRHWLVPKVFWEQEPFLVENTAEMKEAFSPEGYALIKQLGGQSFICCPIVCNGTSMGVLAADKKSRSVPLVQTDLSLLDAVAAYVGIALRNADLLEGMERQLQQLREKDEELARHRESLEDQVKVRTIQLQEAVKAADAASRAKSEFLANMSHEIRTPMTVFLGVIEHLIQIDTVPERNQLLEMADQSAQRLRSLIDDILDLSRIEARRVEIEERSFDLRGCTTSIVNMFQLPAREKRLRLEMKIAPEVPEQVIGDPDRLGQVLINLVGNAVKFTPDGEVRLSVRTRDGLLEFTVADTGIGIPEEKKHLLFESFSQMDNSFHRRYGGSGLGLAISRGLVELMGGNLSVQSRPEKGSLFTITLPLRTGECSEPSTALLQESEKISFARILLAEDDPSIGKMIMLLLSEKGWEVDIAQTGREAVDKWNRATYDLILMDLQMPEMNGIEATRIIREKEPEEAKRTCIIGLTAHARPEILDQCLAVGMDRVMTKPFKMNKLYSALDCLLQDSLVEDGSEGDLPAGNKSHLSS